MLLMNLVMFMSLDGNIHGSGQILKKLSVMALSGMVTYEITCFSYSYLGNRYSLPLLGRKHYGGIQFENMQYLQPDIAALWFLDHIAKISEVYQVPVHHLHLGEIFE